MRDAIQSPAGFAGTTAAGIHLDTNCNLVVNSQSSRIGDELSIQFRQHDSPLSKYFSSDALQ